MTQEDLAALAARLGLPGPSTPGAAHRLDACFSLRAEWSRTHDLVGPAALASTEADLADTLATRAVLAPAVLDGAALLCDVGAGGGTPGLLLACLEPDLPVLLVEPRAKRAAFLRVAAQTIGLRAVRVHRGSWPLGAAPSPAMQVVSRAVVPPPAWPVLALAGGPGVLHVTRLLASERPPPTWRRPFGLAAAVDYVLADGRARRAERWSALPV